MAERYRVGRRLGRTVYRVTDGDEDEFIGIMDTRRLGALVVAALNATSQCASRWACISCRCVLDADHDSRCDVHCQGSPL